MFLRRLATTAGAVAAVAFCAAADVTNPVQILQRQHSAPEEQVQFRSLAFEANVRAKKLFTDEDWNHYQTTKVLYSLLCGCDHIGV